VTALRLAAVALLGAVAVTAALLAADVRAWPLALARGDAVYALDPARARWTPATNLGDLSETLLGTAGDVTARHALQAYRGVEGLQEQLSDALTIQTQRVAAAAALDGPASSADPRVASQARTLLVNMLGSLGQTMKTFQSAVDSAGTPNITNGAKLVATLHADVARVVSSIAQLRTQTASLSTTSAADFETAAEQLAPKLQSAFSSLTSASPIDSKQLDAVAAKTPACRQLGAG